MIDKKSILAQFAKSKKPAAEVSVEIEPKENEMGDMGGSEVKCPCCGEMIKLSASKKPEASSEEPME